MKYENIVIGNLLVPPEELFAANIEDWEQTEKDKTLFTGERNLAKILVEQGVYKSLGEIRRNRPDLLITFDKPEFIDKLKVAKKKYVWIAVGELDDERTTRKNKNINI